MKNKPSKRLSHVELLVTLILMLVIQSFLPADRLIARSIFSLLLLATVLSAIRTLSSSRTQLTMAVTFGVIAYLLTWVVEYHSSTIVMTGMIICNVVVFVTLLIALCESVFKPGAIDLNRIIGASSIYFVLGLAWAFLFALLETLQPGSFRFSQTIAVDGPVQARLAELVYFSNVTLTTLGYGDIVPISRPARTFASLEAIMGQLYVAIIIGRMVGLHIAQQREIE